MGNGGGPDPVGRAGNGSGTDDTAATEESRTDEPTAEDQPEASTCATCWQPIPPDSIRCPHCVTAGGSFGADPETWSFDRVVLAVVPAEGAREARATAVTAFERAREIVSGPDVSHGEITLLAAFADGLPARLTEEWPALSESVPVTSTEGQSLFEAAATRCGDTGTTEPVMYAEDGAPIADAETVETFETVIETAAVQYWVVPGVVRRYSLPDEPDTFGDPLYCADCDAVTEHDTAGPGADATADPEGRLWACRVCGTQRYGPD